MTDRHHYAGKLRNIVISIEFGTTFSGVSYAILEPGSYSQVRSVIGFPGQEDNSSSPKVPTTLYYDPSGQIRAAGAETNDPEIMNQDGCENWLKIDWLGYPAGLQEAEGAPSDAFRRVLPQGKTFPAILGDFFRYLKRCTREYIRSTHADGHVLWEETHNRIEYILSYPDGSGRLRPDLMTVGAIHGGLVADTEIGHSRLHFVSEREAMAHWCVESGLASDGLKVGDTIVVADAGRTTMNVSAFRINSETPVKLIETRPAEHRLAGSQFVTAAFERYIRQHLRGSPYEDDETIEHLVSDFERKSKRIFRETSSSITIQFGRPNDPPAPAYGIRGGRLTLSKDVGMELFEPSVVALTEALKLQIQNNSHTTIFLLGGFSASPYMLAELERRLAGCNITIKRPESRSAKAVADGAVGYFLDRLVDGHFVDDLVIETPTVVTPSPSTDTPVTGPQTLEYTYGVFHHVTYDTENREHVDRPSAIYTESITGLKRVAGKFYPLIHKGTCLEDTVIYGENFSDAVDGNNGIFYAKFVLYCYKGNREDISWRDEDPYNFRPICAFSTGLPKTAIKPRTQPTGAAFLQARYAAVATFGPTGLTCHIEWTDDAGMVQRGRTTTIA